MKYIAFALLTSAFLSTGPAMAQPGCTDPQATNYDASATNNDGSCLYPLTTYTPTLKAVLPGNMPEVSGHVKAGANWYTHNDGGDGARFFRFDPETGVVNQEIQLTDAANKDWEDMAASATHLYIGDFGNNVNNRQDLGIYTVPLTDIGSGSMESIGPNAWSFIPFSYEDQTNYNIQTPDSTVFDCEALVFFEGQLHLFTKNRKAYITSHYIVNQATGKAEKVETFNTDGLITAADVSPDGKMIALLGYDLRGLPKVFVWLLWDWPAGTGQFFNGNKRRIELGSALTTGQAEGIAFAGKRNGYLTNERTIANNITFVEQSVRWFDFSEWVPESTAAGEVNAGAFFRAYPNPFNSAIQLRLAAGTHPDALRVFDAIGQTVLEMNEVPEMLDTGAWPAGLYLIEVQQAGGGRMVRRVVKN